MKSKKHKEIWWAVKTCVGFAQDTGQWSQFRLPMLSYNKKDLEGFNMKHQKLVKVEIREV